MAKYSVVKYFGHFQQHWDIEADSAEDAWIRAEKDGERTLFQCYDDPIDLESRGYVVDLDKKEKERPPISEEQYCEWLREAIGKGMICRPAEYERAFGLSDVSKKRE